MQIDNSLLLPCPFCGSQPKLDNIGNGQCVRIYCVGENCSPYPAVRKYGNGDALERAIAAWNTRADTPLREALEPFLAEIDRLERHYGFDRPLHQLQTMMLPLSALLNLRAAQAYFEMRVEAEREEDQR